MKRQNTTRVLFLVDCLYGDGRGGSEFQLRLMFDRAVAIGIDPHIIFLRHKPIHQELEWQRAPQTLNLSSIFSLRLPKAIRCIKSYMRRHQIHTIQSLFDDSSIVAFIVKLVSSNVNFVCAQRNLGHDRTRVRALLFRAVYRSADNILVNSNGIADFLVSRYGADKNKISLIDNMHNVDRASQKLKLARSVNRCERSSAALRGIVVANLRPVKGVEDLIEACGQLPAVSSVEIVVVGDGAERDRYEQIVNERKLSNRIRFLGFVDDVYRQLAQADFAVMPSRAEGGSNSVIEYMIAALPIVATRVGGNIDFLREGEFGILVDPASPASLCRGLMELEDNYAKWAETAKRAQEAAKERFSLPAVESTYRRFYARVNS